MKREDSLGTSCPLKLNHNTSVAMNLNCLISIAVTASLGSCLQGNVLAPVKRMSKRGGKVTFSFNCRYGSSVFTFFFSPHLFSYGKLIGAETAARRKGIRPTLCLQRGH